MRQSYNSHFGDFRGHGDLLVTSEVTSDLIFEFSGLKTACNHGPLSSRDLFLQNVPAPLQVLLLRLCPYRPLISEASAKRCPLIKIIGKE